VAEGSKSNNKLGISRHEDGSFKLDGASLMSSLGGVWGILESAIPGTAYAIAFALTNNLLMSLYIACTLSLVFVIAQIIRKRPLAQAISGVVGIGIAAYLTLHDGTDAKHARDFYLQGLFTNAGYFVAVSLSILIRWPIVGVLVGALSDGTRWRKNRALVRRYSTVTLIWVALFGLRLLVEVPLYFANAVVALGFVKLLMGVPLYALCLWFTWLAVRPLLRNAD
jgi:hypothetical protein